MGKKKQDLYEETPQKKARFLLLMLGLFVLLSFYALLKTIPSERAPHLYPNVPESRIQFGHGTVGVDFGFQLKNFVTFNLQENHFEIVGFVWFKFNPNLISLSTLEKFSIVDGEILEKRLVKEKLEDGKALAVYFLRASFLSSLDHHGFPFDDHRLFLSLKLESVTSDEVELKALKSNFVVDQDLAPEGWKVISRSIESGYVKTDLSKNNHISALSNPQVNLSLTLQKPGLRKILVVLGPPIFLFLLAMVSFIANPKSAIPLTVTIGSLTGLLVHRFVIERLAPNIGYLTIADYMYLSFLSCVFIVLVINVAELKAELPAKVKYYTFYGMQTFVIVFFFLMLMVRG